MPVDRTKSSILQEHYSTDFSARKRLFLVMRATLLSLWEIALSHVVD